MSLHPISLVDFALDPQLGGFPEASPGQRLVLRLLDGLPPADAEQRELFALMAGRPWGPDVASYTVRKVVALAMGADSGKSVLAAQLLVHRALFAPIEGLRPGQRAVALLVAPDQRLASIPLDYAAGTCETSPVIREELDGDPRAGFIRFTRGTEIRVLPAAAGGRAVRGRRFVAAVLEECAFFRDRDYRVNDEDIVRAIRPRLLSGASLLAISTPYRKAGWLWSIYRRDHGKCRRAVVLQAPTEVMRPDKSRASLQDEYDEDPESASAELGASFLDNVSGLLTAEEVEALVCAGERRRPRPEDPGWRFVAATDPSGLKNDAWAFTVVGRRHEGPAVQFVALAWPPKSSVAGIVEDIGATLAEFGLSRVFSDQYGSEITRQQFEAAGIEFEERPFTSGQTSPKIAGFKTLRDLARGGALVLLDDPAQAAELKLLEVHRLAGGGERIAAPGSLHDDRACALALALSELVPREAHAGLLAYARQQMAKARGVTVEELQVQMAAEREGKLTPEQREQIEAWRKTVARRETIEEPSAAADFDRAARGAGEGLAAQAAAALEAMRGTR